MDIPSSNNVVVADNNGAAIFNSAQDKMGENYADGGGDTIVAMGATCVDCWRWLCSKPDTA